MKINTGSMFTAHRVPSTTVHSNPDTTARMKVYLKLVHPGHRVDSPTCLREPLPLLTTPLLTTPIYPHDLAKPFCMCVVDNHLV